jgi:gamma-glutamylcysteine synthetase
MSIAPPSSAAEPVTDKKALVAYIEEGCKPAADWRIGTEHEKFAYRLEDLRPLATRASAELGRCSTAWCVSVTKSCRKTAKP